MLRSRTKRGLLALMLIGASCCATAAVSADTLQSPHYKFDESVVGGGGLVQSNSANFQAGESIGESGVGDSASASYQFQASNKTTSDPSLSFVVNTSTANFGSFSPAGAATATSTFSVSNYTSYGYVVQVIGTTPNNGSHGIAAMSTTGPSIAGTEQFGMNLVANTSPVSLGANPNHGQFGVGSAATNYNTSNQYRFVSGETIASSPKTSGVTTYTISYIINVGSLTPGGNYSANQTLVCVGTF